MAQEKDFSRGQGRESRSSVFLLWNQTKTLATQATDSKTITINCHLFSFSYIAFYWNNNLSYVLASQTQLKESKNI